MLLFDFLKDIICRKKGDLLNNPENQIEFQPYLIQRWLSFHSSGMVKLLNNTINRLYTVPETKNDWYKLFLISIPKTYFKKIKYIKKNVKEKQKKKEDDIVYEYIARSKQMSKREVEMYIKEFNIDIDHYRDIIKEK